jgi:hypothetical protein
MLYSSASSSRSCSSGPVVGVARRGVHHGGRRPGCSGVPLRCSQLGREAKLLPVPDMWRSRCLERRRVAQILVAALVPLCESEFSRRRDSRLSFAPCPSWI